MSRLISSIFDSIRSATLRSMVALSMLSARFCRFATMMGYCAAAYEPQSSEYDAKLKDLDSGISENMSAYPNWEQRICWQTLPLAHVLGLRPLLALRNVELYRIAFL